MKHKTITRRLMEGEIFDIPKEVDYYVEKWHHDEVSNIQLSEYIGMSDWMYNIFLTNPGYVYEWMEKLRKYHRKRKDIYDEYPVKVIEKKRKHARRKSL